MNVNNTDYVLGKARMRRCVILTMFKWYDSVMWSVLDRAVHRQGLLHYYLNGFFHAGSPIVVYFILDLANLKQQKLLARLSHKVELFTPILSLARKTKVFQCRYPG